MENLGVKKSENEIKTISEVDFIFLAVPIEILDKLLEKINKFSKENCVIMDCCSSRVAAGKKLRKGSRAGLFLLDLIHHLKTNSPSTYKETQILNPYMLEMRDKIISWFKSIHKALNSIELEK